MPCMQMRSVQSWPSHSRVKCLIKVLQVPSNCSIMVQISPTPETQWGEGSSIATWGAKRPRPRAGCKPAAPSPELAGTAFDDRFRAVGSGRKQPESCVQAPLNLPHLIGMSACLPRSPVVLRGFPFGLARQRIGGARCRPPVDVVGACVGGVVILAGVIAATAGSVDGRNFRAVAVALAPQVWGDASGMKLLKLALAQRRR